MSNKDKISEIGKRYRVENKDAVKEKNKRWRSENHEWRREYEKSRWDTDLSYKSKCKDAIKRCNDKKKKSLYENQYNNQDFVLFVDSGIRARKRERQLYKQRVKGRENYKLNSERYRKEYTDKYHSDSAFRLNERVKSQFRKCLIKDRAMGKYYKLLGYDEYELKDHLESKFKPGMSFKNMGEWHVDHIKPKSWFNLLNDDGSVNEEEVKKCWALDNLQPLWAQENISKNNRYIG